MHYYDQIDLLKPTIIKENGYRYYDHKALIKLQTILALKSMNYKLDELKESFSNNEESHIKPEDAWLQFLNKQINCASKKIDELKQKQFILRGMAQTIELSGHIHEEHIFELIKKLDSSDFIDGEIPATFPADIFTEDEI